MRTPARKSAKMGGKMALKVFLSYSTGPDEQVIVWRLQTLAAASGIHVYVPTRTRQTALTSPLPDQVKKAIDESDCVLALITARTSAAAESELTYALQKRRLLIPIVEESVALNPAFHFPQVFRFSRYQMPGDVESRVISFLQQERMSKDKQQTLGALVAVGLGLFLLAALTGKE